MKWHTALLAALTFSCTAGCYSYPERTVAGINAAWQGRHVDGFFIRHGAPSGEYEMDDGRAIYTWSSGQTKVYLPQTTTTTGHVDDFGGFQATSHTTGGRSLNLECRLDILTDRAHLIEEIRLRKDTIGWWKTSRFRELFEQYEDFAPERRGGGN